MPVYRHAVGPAGQRFVRPAAGERVDELVNGDEQVFPVAHASFSKEMVIAFNSSAVAATSIASLKAHLRA